MPLKLIKPRPPSPNWSVRGTYLGRYVNRSTKTSKRAVAVKILKELERQIESGELAKPDEPTFASAALSYMQAGGERTYVGRLLEYFKDTPLTQIDQAAVDNAAVNLYPTATPSTRNRSVYTPISAIIRHNGEILNLRRPRDAGGNKHTTWLREEEAFRLLEEAEKESPEFYALLTVLLYTGMRLGEALSLTWDNVRLQDGEAFLPTTKNNDPRSVFLPSMAVVALANMGIRDGRVFRFTRGSVLYSLLKLAASRAKVELPRRNAFHVFRRTYATWMMRAGMNARQLVGTGAWRDTKMAERYMQTIVSEESRKADLLPTPRKA